jgi:hypothetical protein
MLPRHPTNPTAGRTLWLLSTATAAATFALTALVGAHVGWIPFAWLAVVWGAAGMMGRHPGQAEHVEHVTLLGSTERPRPTAHLSCLSCWICFWLCFGGGGLVMSLMAAGGVMWWLW